jgi:hypothetical protein
MLHKAVFAVPLLPLVLFFFVVASAAITDDAALEAGFFTGFLAVDADI